MKARIILSSLLALFLSVTVSPAATFFCTDPPCLEQAVRVANSNGHANRIQLAAGRYVFRMPAELGLEGDYALPTLTSKLTIEAASTPVILTRDPQAALFRFAAIVAPGDVTLREVIIEGFAVSSAFAQDGGCVHLEHGGTLRLVDSIVRDCEARIGGGIRSRGALHGLRNVFEGNLGSFLAGAIAADGPETTLRSNTFIDNTADTCGAVFLLSPTAAGAVARNNTFIGNTSFRTSGGALCTQGEGVEVVGGHLTDNHSAVHGGAHFALNGRLTVRGSAYSYNTAQINGGAVQVLGNLSTTEVTILDTRILRNGVVFGRGGGLNNAGQAPVVLRQSQLLGNVAPLGPDCAGPVTVHQTRIGDPSGCTVLPE